jgi:glycosyltransferase involved in cell wall biosynthesis
MIMRWLVFCFRFWSVIGAPATEGAAGATSPVPPIACSCTPPPTCRAVFTIHNLNYGADLIGRAMQAAAVATTVSPTYAQEISGNPAVAPALDKMFGVRNGIDMDIWDPSMDPYLPVNYSTSNFEEGKVRRCSLDRLPQPLSHQLCHAWVVSLLCPPGPALATMNVGFTTKTMCMCGATWNDQQTGASLLPQEAAKRALRQRMNLSDTDVPIIGVVTRLTHQKGIHLIKHAAWRTLERGAQFVLLGSAPDGAVQGDFQRLADDLSNQYHDRARLCFSFDEPLSHLIYAGSDMILVPSMFEPCGLTQMIGMRYGTVAVVRKTGGLADTVFDVDHDENRAAEYGMEVRIRAATIASLACAALGCWRLEHGSLALVVSASVVSRTTVSPCIGVPAAFKTQLKISGERVQF